MASAPAPQTSATQAARPAPPAAGAVRFRTLGKTGLKVSEVGYGCMITSDGSVISRAADMGITYFDTARGYRNGNSERMVGAALKPYRDRIVLSSKSEAKTAPDAIAELETSLKELGTDHLDIWYMHNRDSVDKIPDELVTVWENAKQQGKIRHIGISTHNPNAILDRVLSVGKFEVLLSTYSFATGAKNDAAYNKLTAAGIGLVAMKVMAPATKSKKPNAPLAALKWVLRDTRISTTVPSMTDLDQLAMNFRAMAEPFVPEDEQLLAHVDREIRPLYCRMCYQCDGQCPKGAAIPESIRYLSYADFYGQFGLGREHFLALPEKAQAVRCSDCESCQVHCPNGVHVSERMIRAQDLFA
jgi:hypothetical protein